MKKTKETEKTKAKPTKGRLKKILKIIFLPIASLILLLVLVLAGIRLIYVPILRANHKIGESGIDLTESVEIGGIQQVLQFRGEDTENPVILFIHGGPGTPMIPFIHGWQYELESEFTFVQWDQRNTGKTFLLNDPDLVLETLDFDRSVEDAYEITQYIKQKLNKDKIIVIGHSWGSALGSAVVQKYPDEFSAYIAIGQVVNIREGARIGYQATLDAAIAAGNKNDIAALEELAPFPAPVAYNEDFYKDIYTFQAIQAKYGYADGELGALLLAVTSPYYSIGEMMVPLNGEQKLHYQEPLMRFLYDEFDIHDLGTDYQIPVFYIMGENDYNTPHSMAKSFFGEISAPKKEFFSVPDAGHTPMVDNTEEFIRILTEEIRPAIYE